MVKYFNLHRMFISIAGFSEGFCMVSCDDSGYMAPEYAMDGMVSFMQDVYSFGVLLLEIVSGRRNQRNFNLIAHVINQLPFMQEEKEIYVIP